MARLKGNIIFTGRVGNVTAYTRNGSEEIIVRKSKGISGERIKKDPAFKLVRMYGKEFGGCSKAGSKIKRALYTLTKLADFNITSRLNAICKTIQGSDTVNDLGKRSVLFSKEGKLLEGYSLTKRYAFNDVVIAPVNYTITRDLLSAVVEIPKLVPGINLIMPGKYPYFRFTLSLGILPDYIYNKDGGYGPVDPANDPVMNKVHTNWFTSADPISAQAVEIKLTRMISLSPSESLLLSIGLEPGLMDTSGEINWIRYTGCAQILGLR